MRYSEKIVEKFENLMQKAYEIYFNLWKSLKKKNCLLTIKTKVDNRTGESLWILSAEAVMLKQNAYENIDRRHAMHDTRHGSFCVCYCQPKTLKSQK